jgi:lia operon protein LiaF
MQRIDTNKITFWLFAFVLCIFVESMFFHNGSIVLVFIGAGFIFWGMKKRSKLLFFIGIFFLVISLFTLWSLRLLIFTGLVYILIKLWKGVPSEEIMRPLKEFQRETPNGIWKNKLFSVQTSPFSSYEWEDIHIQGVFGDLHIDVTETVLPKGTSIISVRQGIGKIRIDLPYEIPVRVHYTTLLGEAKLFGIRRKRLINESLHMKDSYETQLSDTTELIITLSTWFGDVEVTRK